MCNYFLICDTCCYYTLIHNHALSYSTEWNDSLMGACAGGHLSVLKELVNRGADIDATDNVSLNMSLRLFNTCTVILILTMVKF